jgi:hypothetical protein
MLRDVIEDPNFSAEFDLFRNIYAQMDTLHAGLTFTLGSNPRIGTPIEGYPHPNIRLFITTPVEDTPSFQVLYRYTWNQVILLAIDLFDTPS